MCIHMLNYSCCFFSWLFHPTASTELQGAWPCRLLPCLHYTVQHFASWGTICKSHLAYFDVRILYIHITPAIGGMHFQCGAHLQASESSHDCPAPQINECKNIFHSQRLKIFFAHYITNSILLLLSDHVPVMHFS